MNVFRHDDISQHHEPITPANPIENLQEQITVCLVLEKGSAPVTTESQKVQVVTTIKSVQAFGHERRVEKSERPVCDKRTFEMAGVPRVSPGLRDLGSEQMVVRGFGTVPGLPKPGKPGAPKIQTNCSSPDLYSGQDVGHPPESFRRLA
jgi:hypothetical protein